MNTKTREKGLILVELSVALPLLILVLSMLGYFGFIMYERAIVAYACSKAGRIASVDHQDELDIEYMTNTIKSNIIATSKRYGVTVDKKDISLRCSVNNLPLGNCLNKANQNLLLFGSAIVEISVKQQVGTVVATYQNEPW
jgi:Flp pilus assembly protein TadG